MIYKFEMFPDWMRRWFPVSGPSSHSPQQFIWLEFFWSTLLMHSSPLLVTASSSSSGSSMFGKACSFITECGRYRALRTPSNIILINLCVAGLVMISPLPVFYINLYSRGPTAGIIGAKVGHSITHGDFVASLNINLKLFTTRGFPTLIISKNLNKKNYFWTSNLKERQFHWCTII